MGTDGLHGVSRTMIPRGSRIAKFLISLLVCYFASAL